MRDIYGGRRRLYGDIAADAAAATGGRFTTRHVANFLRREIVSTPLAMALLRAYPEIAQGIVCPTCGQRVDKEEG
jgi:hypothetical protein